MQKIAHSYLRAIAIAESVTVFIAPLPGIIVYAILIPLLLIQFARSNQTSPFRLLPALVLMPILRILSLTMPTQLVPVTYWPILIGIPLLVGVWLTVKLVDSSREQIGLQLRNVPLQLAIGMTGIPLSLLAYHVLRFSHEETHLPETLTGLVILLIFSGVVEELLFRGVILDAARDVYGQGAIVYSTILYVIMCLGTLSIGLVVIVGISGLIGAWCTERTRSLLGAILLRTCFLSGLIAIWPAIYAG